MGALYDTPMPTAPTPRPYQHPDLGATIGQAYSVYNQERAAQNNEAGNQAIADAYTAHRKIQAGRWTSQPQPLSQFNSGQPAQQAAPTEQMIAGFGQVSDAQTLSQADTSVHAAFANDPPDVKRDAAIYEAGTGLNYSTFQAIDRLVAKGHTLEQAKQEVSVGAQKQYSQVGGELMKAGYLDPATTPHQYDLDLVDKERTEAMGRVFKYHGEKGLALWKEFLSEDKSRAFDADLEKIKNSGMSEAEQKKAEVDAMRKYDPKQWMALKHEQDTNTIAANKEANVGRRLDLQEKHQARVEEIGGRNADTAEARARIFEAMAAETARYHDEMIKLGWGKNAVADKKADNAGGISETTRTARDKKDGDIEAARKAVTGKTGAELSLVDKKTRALALERKYSEGGGGQTEPGSTGGARKPLTSIFSAP